MWATPQMSATHLVFALAITAYFVIGALFEEVDLRKDFGEQYQAYMAETPMIVPAFKKA